FYINRACPITIDALKSAIWDSKNETEDVRLDNGTTNIDSLDALEYAYEREIPNLIAGWRNA
ncbi:MAG: PBSX family phage terminase large subunit, partial [Lentisphaeria bacterium]|nr:PBSX family phage terminase large subunit [Lentisphaeria bacterium]